ncbi:MAG: hypothetical protein ISR57_08790 [Bacteroidales bacterium]|nr:hypothetical protein [Bacteroidota bacterium]MBL6950723.1 hypothetical protein [Bacteroidales bacterium]
MIKTKKFIQPIIFVILISLLSISCEQEMPETQEGEAQVYQLWNNLKQKNFEIIEKSMASGFQSIHQYGANDLEAEMKLIYNLEMSDYTITDLIITSNEDLIIATYFVSVAETIDGVRLSKEPAPRMTIFIQIDDEWKWIAHANLKPIPEKVEEHSEGDNDSEH